MSCFWCYSGCGNGGIVILVHCATAVKLLLDEMSTWIGVLTIISQIAGQLPNMEDATLNTLLCPLSQGPPPFSLCTICVDDLWVGYCCSCSTPCDTITMSCETVELWRFFFALLFFFSTFRSQYPVALNFILYSYHILLNTQA